jgi:hypothetical protein
MLFCPTINRLTDTGQSLQNTSRQKLNRQDARSAKKEPAFLKNLGVLGVLAVQNFLE